MDTIAGCTYPDRGEVFVKRGDTYPPAALMLGKRTQAAARHICSSENGQVASAK